MIIKNTGYAPGLALGRRWVNKVSTDWLRGSLLYENLLVLLNDLLVILFVHGHELYQLVIYMHEMMMQHFSNMATTALKIKYIYLATK